MKFRRALVALMLYGCGDNNHLGGGHLLVSPEVNLRTNEAGATATFTVSLTQEPLDDITVSVATTASDEGTVDKTQLRFSPDNFDIPQTVAVTGVDDDRADGNQLFAVRLDGQRLGIVDVTVMNDDDDSAGFVVTPIVGLSTTETGGGASFTVRLLSQPAADVMIPIASSDPTEGIANVASLTFTADNWNVAQMVDVTGVEDATQDGAVAYAIRLAPAQSDDAVYNTLDPDDVSLMNRDNELTGIIVTGGATPLATTEAGGTATFTLALQSEPTANVTIPISSSNPAEGTVSPSSVTFTPANWSQPQTITITGVDDAATDGDIAYSIILGAATSADPLYAGMNADDVSAINRDNDNAPSASILVSPSSLTVSEFTDTDAFTMVLDRQPTANITIALSSSDMSEGTVSPSSVTFTPANWSTPQQVIVTGVNDSATDGNIAFTIVTTSVGLDVADVAVTNIDDETPQVYVKARNPIVTSEAGFAATFRVRLTQQPQGPVTCTLSSSDASEGTVSPASLMFSPGNFGFRTVTVTGTDDNANDGDVSYTVLLDACTSNDARYSGFNPPDVSAINVDDE